MVLIFNTIFLFPLTELLISFLTITVRPTRAISEGMLKSSSGSVCVTYLKINLPRRCSLSVKRKFSWWPMPSVSTPHSQAPEYRCTFPCGNADFSVSFTGALNMGKNVFNIPFQMLGFLFLGSSTQNEFLLPRIKKGKRLWKKKRGSLFINTN